MPDARLTELESKLAFQDDAIQQLSDLVYAQRQQLDALEALCRRLVERLDSVDSGGAAADPADEVPPHY